MRQLIIHHHGRDERVTPIAHSRTAILVEGEDGERHTIKRTEISGVRVPDREES